MGSTQEQHILTGQRTEQAYWLTCPRPDFEGQRGSNKESGPFDLGFEPRQRALHVEEPGKDGVGLAGQVGVVVLSIVT